MKMVIKDVFSKQILIIQHELFNLHKDLPFLPENKKVNNVEKLIYDMEDKKKYVIHRRTLKQALNNGLRLKQVHRIIQLKKRHG